MNVGLEWIMIGHGWRKMRLNHVGISWHLYFFFGFNDLDDRVYNSSGTPFNSIIFASPSSTTSTYIVDFEAPYE